MDFLGSGRWVREKAAVLCTVLREKFLGLPSVLQRGFAKSFICHARGIQIKLPELCQNLIFFPSARPSERLIKPRGSFFLFFISCHFIFYHFGQRLPDEPPSNGILGLMFSLTSPPF